MARSSKQTSTPVSSPQPTTQPATHVANSLSARQSAPTQEQIARRAYELFLERGGTHGNHVDDWVQAERELSLSRRA